MAAFFSLRRRGPLKSDERVGILSLILPLLLHFTILGHRNVQNVPPNYIVKRGNKTDEKRSNKKAASGREIAPNTGANAPKFFTLATKS